MDSTELRGLQQPLKDAYREDPEKAVVTLRARGQLDDAVSCSVETGQALAVAGLHPATGGDGSLLCSGDMLLQALVACAGVTLRAVATSLQIAVTGGTVHAEGDLDFRGTLAVSKDAPVGFRSIRLAFDLDTDASAKQVQTLIKLTERYCVVYQTLVASGRDDDMPGHAWAGSGPWCRSTWPSGHVAPHGGAARRGEQGDGVSGEHQPGDHRGRVSWPGRVGEPDGGLGG